MKSVRIRSFFNPYFPRKAPNTDTFYAGKCANLLAKDMNNKHQNIFLFLEIDIETKYCFYTLSGIEKTMCLFVVLKSKKNYNLFFLDCKFGHIYTLLHRCFSTVSDLWKFYFVARTSKKSLFKMIALNISLTNVFSNERKCFKLKFQFQIYQKEFLPHFLVTHL